MCSPSQAAGASAAGSTVSGLFGAYGAVQGGYAKQDYYNSLAGTQDDNASEVLRTADTNVTRVQDVAAQEGKTVHQQGKMVEGAQKVSMAANGVGAGSASAEDVARDSFNKEKLDELAIRYNADLKSNDIRNQAKFKADDLRKQAAMSRTAGKNAVTSGWESGIGSLLGSATQLAVLAAL